MHVSPPGWFFLQNAQYGSSRSIFCLSISMVVVGFARGAQAHGERTASIFDALDVDSPAVFLDDKLCEVETEARPGDP